jgi:hypothetical protein
MSADVILLCDKDLCVYMCFQKTKLSSHDDFTEFEFQ